jgi:hypothetical protein
MDTKTFFITLELIHGTEFTGYSVRTAKVIAVDSFVDGGISALAMTDNLGDVPYRSPDVIIEFTCRDMNRSE